MSRAPINDSGDHWEYIKWAGAAKKAIHGKRGQEFLRELEAALLALPEKKLIGFEFACEDGAVCALGAVAVERKMKTGVDRQDAAAAIRKDFRGGEFGEPDFHEVGRRIGITPTLAWEIMHANDEPLWPGKLSDEQRYQLVLDWVQEKLGKQTTK